MTGRWSWTAALILGAMPLLGCGDADTEASESMQAQEPTPAQALACAPQADVEERASPYDSTTFDVGDAVAKICYSRPSLRGRTMIGGEAVPYGQVWRTGANEPTTIHLTTPASIAGIDVEPGSYSLYTIPRAEGAWTLIVNASTSQWGHESTYPEVEDQDVGRVDVDVERLEEPVEQFTIRPMADGTGILLEWQHSRVRVPITAE